MTTTKEEIKPESPQEERSPSNAELDVIDFRERATEQVERLALESPEEAGEYVEEYSRTLFERAKKYADSEDERLREQGASGRLIKNVYAGTHKHHGGTGGKGTDSLRISIGKPTLPDRIIDIDILREKRDSEEEPGPFTGEVILRASDRLPYSEYDHRHDKYSMGDYTFVDTIKKPGEETASKLRTKYPEPNWGSFEGALVDATSVLLEVDDYLSRVESEA